MTPEASLQCATATYLRSQYPTVLAIHVPNEGIRTPQQGARLKAQGLLPGVADWLIFSPHIGRKPHGLALELKSAKGSLTDTQKEFLRRIAEQHGWKTAVARDLDTAMQLIDDFILKGI